MPEIGQNISHYSIVEKIGKGGMGEVFRAKDQKLGRNVAIKVLPEEFAKDADRVARFQREAKLLASLNHPNIAAIHGLEESGGIQFLVLELVEGETLADRIKTGPIPVEESLKLALQIAEALEAAHEKGVIHRDLKPANIKVTPDGKVKVLDFGLAKAFAGDQAELNLSNSPTVSNAATQQGVILGTAAYMSPEQARGESVDKKADIWAFGCVLFEMLTGRGTFEGRTVSDVLASVIKSEPEWKRLPPNLHPRIRLLLERCLEKEAKNRYSGIGDARVDIQKALADPSGVFVQSITAVEPRRKLRMILPWVAAAIVLGSIVTGVAVWRLKPPEPRQVTRFDYNLPEGQQFYTGSTNFPVLAVSPEGRQFVYGALTGLYLRSVDELTAKLIPGTEGPTSQPFFSPDGKWIGYFSDADRKLKKIAISGGAPVVLCDVGVLLGASWDAGNTIVYGQLPGDIMRIPASGGTPEPMVKRKAMFLAFPQLLPDGKSVLYTAVASVTQMRVMVQSLKSGESKELFAGFAARYLPTGHIVYGLPNNNNAFAVPFDLDGLEVKGEPVGVVEGVAGGHQCAISDSGTLVYIPRTASSSTSSQRTLLWVDRKGKEEPVAASPNNYEDLKISPDGRKVALTVSPAMLKSDIWIWDLVRETMTRLTFNENSSVPLWTPDGQRIAFNSVLAENNPAVYWKAADGTGEEERLGSVKYRLLAPSSWSSDGKTLVLSELSLNEELNRDVGALSMEGDRKWRPLLKEKYSEARPKISPDGQWMAYESDESGQAEVYVRPFPEVNKGRWQISTGGGDIPLWSPDGRELFYRKGDSVMTVATQTEPIFKAGKPELLFQGKYASPDSNGQPWDINPDGKRFLMMKEAGSTGKPAPAEGPRKINIVLNWFEELKQRVPVK